MPDGSKAPLDENRLRKVIQEACADVDGADAGAVIDETLRQLFDGVAEADVARAAAMSARMFIERVRLAPLCFSAQYQAYTPPLYLPIPPYISLCFSAQYQA